MDRRGWIMALGAVALIAVGFGVWWNDAQDPARVSARVGEAPRASTPGGSGMGSPALARHAVPADAGLRAHVPSQPSADVAVRPPAPAPARAVGPDELPRNATDTDHSTGWRLGQTRRRIAILNTRLERLQGQVEALEQQGRPDVAARQRAVLERFESRLGEMRAEEQELLPLAQSDGTMAEAERGYEEGETESERPVSPAVTPTPVP